MIFRFLISIIIILNLLNHFDFFNSASATDCILEEISSFKQIIEGAIPEIEGNLNNLNFQINCSKFPKNPPPPYLCDKIDEIHLQPIPDISQMSLQNSHKYSYGVCYAAASLFALQREIENQTPMKKNNKLSLSDAIYRGNICNKKYKEGGIPAAFLLNLANQGQLVKCEHEKIQHSDLVNNICKNKAKFNSKLENFSKISQRINQHLAHIHNYVGKRHKQSEFIQIPKFYINEIDFSSITNNSTNNNISIDQNNDSVFKIFSEILKDNHVIMLYFPTHITNLIGMSRYLCKKDSTKLTISTMHLMDPNGFVAEIISDNATNLIASGKILAQYLELANPNEEIPIEKIYRGKHAIYSACGTGNIDIVKKYLIANKHNVNDGFLTTPLFNSINDDYVNIVELLLQNGANPNMPSRGITPLSHAIQKNNKLMVKLLLKYGADVNKRIDDSQDLPIIKAIKENKHQIFKILLKKKANITLKTINSPMRGSTALHFAVAAGNIKMVKMLLQKGKLTEQLIKNYDGNSPYDIAISNKNSGIVKLFEDNPVVIRILNIKNTK
ncbi:MAG: ankyrin repeat domain-containing protein [Oligoflexia bacterium]|nr:ankyrin repeat domain-containing protein [Oligoflexia bacterium]